MEIEKLKDKSQAGQTESLLSSEQLKSSLLDNVTYALRTPLTVIKAAATTLLEDLRVRTNKEFLTDDDLLRLDEEGRREFLEVINEETDRLNKFVGQLIHLAKAEVGELHPRKNPIEVEEIIGNAVGRMKNCLTSHFVLIEIEPEMPVVLADADLIVEVVSGLLENAASNSPKSSKIKILVRQSEKEIVEIAVEDSGHGVAQEMRQKVFDKFFRMSEKEIFNTSSGLGLGLAVARGIVEAHGGKIWIENGRDDYVTRVAFQIPIGGEK